MTKQIRPLDRTHLLVFLFSVIIGQALYMLLEQFNIGEWFFPIWLAVIIIFEGYILIKDAIEERLK